MKSICLVVRCFGDCLGVKISEILKVYMNGDVFFEVVSSFWVFEGDVSVIVVDLSDLGLFSFCSVLEFVIDVGYYIMLEDFDVDDGCSVLSEFVLRFVL